ncbi:hypothetical protein J5Y04_20995 [Kitasatospora sp. RG8]|uniref:hypothetical protein n=1 Tax=Kitasatospora sp. RG8 TaxID=2820815 RepID=UPI001AE0902D|nr:hypothetical protein [Kitasatospora sp. RG8]MBP0451997.1 hypothetical protein [Kitasatospora sp. RG8]
MGKRLASCFVLTALATAVMAGPASAATATATAAAAATITVRAAGPDADPLHLVPKPVAHKPGKDGGSGDLRWE